METISGAVANVTSIASKAIWGEGANPDEKKENGTTGNEILGKEPVAGELGDVKSGEPYDKGNVDGADDTTTSSLPAKSTLTSNPKPTTTETTSGPSAAAFLLSESSSTSGDTPTNLLANSNTSSTANAEKAAKVPSETSDSEALTFSKSDPADDKKIGTSAGVTGTKTGTESLEEKASAVKGTTGFDTKTPEPSTTTSTTKDTSALSGASTTSGAPPLTGAPALRGAPEPKIPSRNEGLREENVGSTGLLEEKRVKPEAASEPKIGENSTSTSTSTPSSSTPKKSLEDTHSGEGDKEKKSLKEKIKEKLHRHKD